MDGGSPHQSDDRPPEGVPQQRRHVPQAPRVCRAAYFLDARFRADLLAAPKVRETVQYLMEVAWPLFGEGEAPIENGYLHDKQFRLLFHVSLR